MTENDIPPRGVALKVLKGRIDGGVYGTGDILPSERALSEELDIGRRSVRWALEQLVAEGIIHNKTAKTRAVSSPLNEKIPLFGECFLLPSEEYARGKMRTIREEIMSALCERGAGVILTKGDLAYEEYMSAFECVRPAGLFLTYVSGKRDFSALRRAAKEVGVPIVSNCNEKRDEEIHRVIPDHERGAYEVTRKLLEKECSRPVMFRSNKKPFYWMLERRAGYERAMVEAGLTPLPEVIVDLSLEMRGGEEEKVRARARFFAGFLGSALLGDSKADAVLCTTDGEVAVVGEACRMLGRIPGEDLLLAGYDNYWKGTNEYKLFGYAPAVTVDKRSDEIARESVKMMFSSLAGYLPKEAQLKKILPKVIDEQVML